MTELPRFALSVRQPWAYAIAMGWKKIENRNWAIGLPARAFRGDFCLHASTVLTKREFDDAAAYIRARGHEVPSAALLSRGGIVAIGKVVDVVRKSEDEWFFKRPRNVGLVLADVRPIDFIPARGQLGFFEWKPDLSYVTSPAKWMLAAATAPKPSQEQFGI